MNTTQRKIHIGVWCVVGPLAMLGLVLAVVWRAPEPVQDGPLPGIERDAQVAPPEVDGRP